jgi:hypothetical protein
MLTALLSVGGGAVNNISTHATSVNPAWRDSIGYLDVPVFGTNATVTAAQRATQESLTNALDAVLRKHDLPVAAYYNEQTLQAKNWKQLSWGASYPRLAHIKRKVDPRGVFSVRLWVEVVRQAVLTITLVLCSANIAC